MARHFSSSTQQNLDAIMQQGLQQVFPAAVLHITQNTQTIFHRAYGWIDPEQQTGQVHRQTLFDIASLSKLFTATVLMQALQTNQLGLQTPITRVLPEMQGKHPLLPGIDPHSKQVQPQDPALAHKKVDAGQITFWHLLTHTSGLAAWENLCNDAHNSPPPFPQHLPAKITQRRIKHLLRTPRFVYLPGTRFLYSDLGFILLGEAVTRLTGKSLQDSVITTVCEPLGMKFCTYRPLTCYSQQQIAPTEYCPWRQRRLWGEVHDENASCLGGIAGHAGLFASASDVSCLGHAMLKARASNTFLSEMTHEQYHWQGVRRGLGWQLASDFDNPVGPGFSPHSFGHTGFTGTSLWVEPEQQLVITLLTNRVYYGRNSEPITQFRMRLHSFIASELVH